MESEDKLEGEEVYTQFLKLLPSQRHEVSSPSRPVKRISYIPEHTHSVSSTGAGRPAAVQDLIVLPDCGPTGEVEKPGVRFASGSEAPLLMPRRQSKPTVGCRIEDVGFPDRRGRRRGPVSHPIHQRQKQKDQRSAKSPPRIHIPTDSVTDGGLATSDRPMSPIPERRTRIRHSLRSARERRNPLERRHHFERALERREGKGSEELVRSHVIMNMKMQPGGTGEELVDVRAVAPPSRFGDQDSSGISVYEQKQPKTHLRPSSARIPSKRSTFQQQHSFRDRSKRERPGSAMASLGHSRSLSPSGLPDSSRISPRQRSISPTYPISAISSSSSSPSSSSLLSPSSLPPSRVESKPSQSNPNLPNTIATTTLPVSQWVRFAEDRKEEEVEEKEKGDCEVSGRSMTGTRVPTAVPIVDQLLEEDKMDHRREEESSTTSSGRIVYSKEVERRLAFTGRVGSEMKKDPLSIVEDSVAPVMFRKPTQRLHVPDQAPRSVTTAGSDLIALSKRLAVKKADDFLKTSWRHQTDHSRPTSTPMHRRRSLLDTSS